jgi:hypothetical protein
MSRPRVLAGAAAWIAVALSATVAGPLRAQAREELADQMARITARGVAWKLADPRFGPRAQRAPAPQIGRSGAVVVAIGSDDPAGRAQAIAEGLASAIDSAAPWARPAAERVVFFAHTWGVSSLQGTTGRRPIHFDAPRPVLVARSVQAASWTLGIAMVADDSIMRSWVGNGVDLLWDSRERNALIIAELIRGGSPSGTDCLRGGAAACAMWLGLDERARYTPEDARQQLRDLFSQARRPLSEPYESCWQGDDEACYRIQIIRYPSSDDARRSLFHFVAATYGPDVTLRLLADGASSIGARLTRATGKPPAQLASAWRTWLFAEAHWEPVRAGAREALPTMVVIGLMLAFATRSGRWRA